jgi:succinate dehydrogenase / fumarate reductase cytochrome b subunit
MSQTNRPLSPHVQIYRRQLTMVLSISHRITGVILCGGALLLAVWLISLASSEQSFASVSAIVGSIPGQLILIAFTLVLFFHLCNGIRHLFWDVGYGFEKGTAHASGKMVLIASVVLTLIIWGAALMNGG